MATPEPTPAPRAILVTHAQRACVWHQVAPWTDQVHRQMGSENWTLIDVRTRIEEHLKPGSATPVMSTDDLLFMAGSILAMIEQRVLLAQAA